MGGRSSSKSSSSTTTNTYAPQVGEAERSQVITGVDGPVNITDGGAFDLAENALMFSRENNVDTLEAIGDTIEGSYTLVGEAQNAGYSFAGEAVTKSLDSIIKSNAKSQELARQVTANLNENARYTIDQVAEANTSETARMTTTMTLTVAVLLAFIAWRNSQ